MQNFYFTFGCNTARKNNFVTIAAADRNQARECMFQHYGINWAFSYDEQEFAGQAEQFGLSCLETIQVGA